MLPPIVYTKQILQGDIRESNFAYALKDPDCWRRVNTIINNVTLRKDTERYISPSIRSATGIYIQNAACSL